MYRDERLRGLSSDHHQALVLVRTLRRQASEGSDEAGTLSLLSRAFEQELEPHFRVEEELLLPALRGIGERELAARTQEDHDEMRALVESARVEGMSPVLAFAELLEQHVRFEERVLFPACEETLSARTLAAVMDRCPPPGG